MTMKRGVQIAFAGDADKPAWVTLSAIQYPASIAILLISLYRNNSLHVLFLLPFFQVFLRTCKELSTMPMIPCSQRFDQSRVIQSSCFICHPERSEGSQFQAS